MTETVTRAKQQLASSLRHLLELSYQKLDDKQDRAKRALMTLVRMQKMKLTALSKHLYAIHPKVTLKKGYCICFSENSRSAIMSSGDIHVSQNLSLLFYDGEVDAIATKVRHEV